MTDETDVQAPPAPAAERVAYAHGFHPDIPLDDYFADPAKSDFGSLNSSNIPTLRKRSPLHFATRSPVLAARYQLEMADDAPNAASRRGKTVHRIALGKGDDYEAQDYPDFRTKEAKAWRDDCEQRGVTPMLHKDMAGTQKQADLLRGHLAELFQGRDYVTEVAVLWEEHTPFGVVQCRALIDAWCADLKHGCDIKSSTDASWQHVTRRMDQGGYDIQNVWYRRGLRAALDLGPGHVQFTTLFGETKPPYASQGFQLSDMWETSAWDECQLALRTFAQCQGADRFPGYQRNPRALTPPPYLITRRMEAELQIDDLDDEVEDGE